MKHSMNPKSSLQFTLERSVTPKSYECTFKYSRLEVTIRGDVSYYYFDRMPADFAILFKFGSRQYHF